MPADLPDGFVVRLRDEVEVGELLVSSTRIVRMSDAAREMLGGRELAVTSRASSALATKLLDLDLAEPVVDGVQGSGVDDITVVVPVRDNADGVDRLLAGLAPHVRCIVVDDASADPHVLGRVVERHDATLIRLDRNVGPAAARDVGLRDVRTRLVAFADSDMEVSIAALAELARHFADPGLAAIGPRIRSRGGRRWFERYDDACGSLDLGPISAAVRPWSRVSYLPSACLLARVDVLGAGFDPRLRSGEDVDLVWRLQAAGHRIRYAAEVEAEHDVRRSVRAWLGRKAFYGSSAAPLAARHGDRVAPAVLTPVGAAAIAGVLLQRRGSWSVAALCGGWLAGDARRRLPELTARQRVDLARATVGVMSQQTSALALRHWWPASLVLAAGSTRARRALTVMTVIDGLVAHRSSGARLDPVRFTLARRADDLAYGAGVWWGALRAGSARCLMPRRP